MPTLTIRLTRADRVRRGDFLRSEGRTLFVTETIRGADRTVLISADDEAGLRAWSRRRWSREAVLDVLVPESEKPAESLESAESPEPAGAAADPMMTVVPTAPHGYLRPGRAFGRGHRCTTVPRNPRGFAVVE